MPIAALKGVKLHYDVTGSGPPVLLIMGLAIPGSGWNPQIEGLRHAYTVCSFDNRGCGRSEVPRGPYTTGQMADDALGLMDHLGWADAHVVGISMGGMIAQMLALKAPRRVRSLGLLATHGGGRSALPRPQTVRRFMAAHFARDPLARVDALNRILYTPDFIAANQQELRQGMLRGLGSERMGTRAFSAQAAATFAHRTGPRLRALSGIRTLLATGLEDVAVDPRNTRRLAGWMPWADVWELPGVGHGMNVQAGDAVNERLDRLFVG
jgi:pimeloyl-ACP methyl ester carboxylesterase